ncbi:EexN family lipoprotein [Sphingomonas sp. GC_Shp_6]|uniref:EexN family lipoprotein n=1 Tax=Sphingomonas sp. GC_Shp_6 TaxID=2937378 RepID=UPI00226A0AEF|nr:EexN family lipoprotein [Sphingomonas sp. GC_Shp_6]
MARAIVVVAVAALSLSACHSPVAEPRTMHFFQEHEAERADVIGKCRQSDRQYQPAEECANALRAQRQVNMDHDAGTGSR